MNLIDEIYPISLEGMEVLKTLNLIMRELINQVEEKKK